MTRLFSVLGDSISTFAGAVPAGFAVFYEGERCAASGVLSVRDTWWDQVIRHFGGEVLACGAWSGSMVAGAGFPAGESFGRASALACDGRIPDDVLVYFGTNDYGWGSPHAQAAARASAVPRCLCGVDLPKPDVAGVAPADAARAFGEAYACMLSNVRAAFPAARVWCCALVPGRVRGSERSTFPRTFRGVSFSSYNEAIRAAAEAAGYAFCDLAAWGFDYEGVEGTHPTALGMRQLAWMVERCLERAGEAPGAETDPASMREYPGGAAFLADDPCDVPGRACVGCPYALDTGNSWMHVCLRREAALSEAGSHIAWPYPPSSTAERDRPPTRL